MSPAVVLAPAQEVIAAIREQFSRSIQIRMIEVIGLMQIRI
jgi:hypothetical protein